MKEELNQCTHDGVISPICFEHMRTRLKKSFVDGMKHAEDIARGDLTAWPVDNRISADRIQVAREKIEKTPA